MHLQYTDDAMSHVKTLFVQKKYRQCIHICETLLGEVFDDKLSLYLHFYLGMAHDDLARQMYDLSRFKNTRFALAEQHYEEALELIVRLQRNHMSPPHLPREPSSMCLIPASPKWSEPSFTNTPLTEHATAMRDQILTHLTLVQEAKTRANEAQKKRAAQGKRDSPYSTPTSAKPQSSKSYWLFTPDVIKASEKQSRIGEGRARGWKKERFKPERYKTLAEIALSEL